MKYILVLFVIFSLLGLEGERIIRTIANGLITWKEKLKQLKLLLMLPVYGIACVIIELIFRIQIMQKITLLPIMMLIGGIIATLIELGFGMLYNKILKLDIWNYDHSYITIGKKKIPLNILGQIDLLHFFMWSLLTIVVIYFSKILEWLIN